MRQAATIDGPFLVDAVVNAGVLSMPPNLNLDQAWGFGVSKLREAGILARHGDHEQWQNWEDAIRALL